MNSRLFVVLCWASTLAIGSLPPALAQSKPVPVRAIPSSSQAKTYETSALAKFRANNIPGALADIGLAITAAPQDPQLYLHRGLFKSYAADQRGAIADFDQALKLRPNLSEAFALRASSRRELKDFKGALSDYDRALSLNSKEAAIYLDRGRLKQMQLNDPRGAVSDFDQAIALGDRDAFNYSFRASAKRSLGDRNGAIADLKESIRLASQQSEPVYKRLIRANQDLLQSLGVKP
jgi:tetratricopeptide (TPR) repeat protein